MMRHPLAQRIHGLYVIIDTETLSGMSFSGTAEQVLKGGARILQYRDKSTDTKRRQQQARVLTGLCRKYDALHIINDDPDLAMSADADGVHVGRDDNSVRDICKAFPQMLIGASCYNSLELAHQRAGEGASYLAFGSFYPSPTKPQAVKATPALLKSARQELDQPLVAVGGIMAENAQVLIESGADAVAVISAVLKDRDPQRASKDISSLFGAE
ncbi:MAG TPA: thiamine phosphate synthase [Gammaproteobacteria bacterium]|nr:thiamine phosphate synthase [Gammaproteobacteria bacterium]